jgi:hypothetical protein
LKIVSQIFFSIITWGYNTNKRFIHLNPHAGAAPAQIGMKTEAAEFSVFMWYNVLKRGKLQSTVGGVARNSSAAKAV